jgi:hypothetical protein
MAEPEIVYKSNKEKNVVQDAAKEKPEKSKSADKSNQQPKPQVQASNPVVAVVDKAKSKATAKSAKVTLVIDPSSITRVETSGIKQTNLTVAVDEMMFEVDINSKSYRKVLATIDELGADNCNVILQGSMKLQVKLENAGLAVQPKKAKEEVKQES